MGTGEGPGHTLSTGRRGPLPIARALGVVLAVSAVTDLGLAVVTRDDLTSRVAYLIGPGLRQSGLVLDDGQLARRAEVYIYAGLATGAVVTLLILALAARLARFGRASAAWAGAVVVGVLALVPCILVLPPSFRPPVSDGLAGLVAGGVTIADLAALVGVLGRLIEAPDP